MSHLILSAFSFGGEQVVLSGVALILCKTWTNSGSLGLFYILTRQRITGMNAVIILLEMM